MGAEGSTAQEIQRVRKDRIQQLKILVTKVPETSAQELVYYLYQLATALQDHGQDSDAKQYANRAKALAKAAGVAWPPQTDLIQR